MLTVDGAEEVPDAGTEEVGPDVDEVMGAEEEVATELGEERVPDVEVEVWDDITVTDDDGSVEEVEERDLKDEDAEELADGR